MMMVIVMMMVMIVIEIVIEIEKEEERWLEYGSKPEREREEGRIGQQIMIMAHLSTCVYVRDHVLRPLQRRERRCKRD